MFKNVDEYFDCCFNSKIRVGFDEVGYEFRGIVRIEDFFKKGRRKGGEEVGDGGRVGGVSRHGQTSFSFIVTNLLRL